MQRKRFAEELRDSLNILPEDLRDIYILETEKNGEVKVGPNTKNGWKLMTKLNSRYHRNTNGPQGTEAKYNRKFVQPDERGGSIEAVICFPPGKEPYLVTDPVNKGTYNFISPVRGTPPFVTPHTLIGHLRKDLLPYLKEYAGKKTGKKDRKKDR